jgi:predicted DNA-binding helix-hairpin-helix protein
VPGIGPLAARRLVAERADSHRGLADLRRLGVTTRAGPHLRGAGATNAGQRRLWAAEEEVGAYHVV